MMHNEENTVQKLPFINQRNNEESGLTQFVNLNKYYLHGYCWFKSFAQA